MTVQERDFYRLNILKKLCEVTDYDPSVQYAQYNEIIQLYNVETDEQYKLLVSNINYLTQKGYLKSQITCLPKGLKSIFMIQLTSLGIDVIENIERKNPLYKYEEDFSKESMIQLGNIMNSTVIINSPNTTVTINQTITKIKELNGSTISAEEKEFLIRKLNELDKTEKKSKWTKAKEIIGWIIDKGADVAITVLPFILENLK